MRPGICKQVSTFVCLTLQMVLYNKNIEHLGDGCWGVLTLLEPGNGNKSTSSGSPRGRAVYFMWIKDP